MNIFKQISEMEKTHKLIATLYFTLGVLIGIAVGGEAKGEEVAPFVSGEVFQNLDSNTDWYAGGKQTGGTGNIKAGFEIGVTKDVTTSLFIYHESMSNYGYDYGHNGIGVGVKVGGL